MAQLALLEYPIVGQWETAKELIRRLTEGDRQYFGYLR